MKEQAFLFEQNSTGQNQWVPRDGHEVKKWIARNGSGQGFVGYTILLGFSSLVAAISYGIFIGVFNSTILTILTSLPK